MKKFLRAKQLSLAFILAVLIVLPAALATPATITSTTKPKSHIAENSSAQKRMSRVHHRRHRHHYYERFYTSSFADDVTAGDVIAGEDAAVRPTAIDALGTMNGSDEAIDPATRRMLAMAQPRLPLS